MILSVMCRTSSENGQSPSQALAMANNAPLELEDVQQEKSEISIADSVSAFVSATAEAGTPTIASSAIASPPAPVPVVASCTADAHLSAAGALAEKKAAAAAENRQLEVLPVLEAQAAKEVIQPEQTASPAVTAAVAAVAKVRVQVWPCT